MKWTIFYLAIVIVQSFCLSTLVRSDGPLFDPSLVLASFALASGGAKPTSQRSCSSLSSSSIEPGHGAHISTVKTNHMISPGVSSSMIPIRTASATQSVPTFPINPNDPSLLPARSSCYRRPICSAHTITHTRATCVVPAPSANQTEEETTSPTEEDDTTSSNAPTIIPTPICPSNPNIIATLPAVTLVSTLTASVSVPVLTTSIYTSPSAYIVTSLSMVLSTTTNHVPTVLPTTLTVKEPGPSPSTLTVPSISYLFSTVQIPTTVSQAPLAPTPIIQYTIVQQRRPPLTRTRVFIRPVTVAVPVTRTLVSTTVSDHISSLISVSTVVSEKTVTMTQSVTAKESIVVKQQSTLTTRERVGYPIAIPVPMEVHLSTQVAIATPSYPYYGPASNGLYGSGSGSGNGGANNALASAAPALSMAAQSLLNQQMWNGNMYNGIPTQGYMSIIGGGGGGGNPGYVSTIGYGPLYPASTSYNDANAGFISGDGWSDSGDDAFAYNSAWYPTPTKVYQTEGFNIPTDNGNMNSGLIWSTLIGPETTNLIAPSPLIGRGGERSSQGQGWITPSSSGMTQQGGATPSSNIVYTTVTRSRSTTSV